MSESSNLQLAPYPGVAAGEAIVHGLKIATGNSTKRSDNASPSEPRAALQAQGDPQENVVKDEEKPLNGLNSPNTGLETSNTPSLPTLSSPISSNATIAVDAELIGAIFEGLARQHEQLVAQLTTLSDVITKDAVEGISDLIAAAEVLEDTFYRIDVLHAKVEYLNYFVVQPLSQAVKIIHKPKDLKGKAISVLKSFGFKSSSSDEAEAEAMWSRIPPFVIIGDPPAHPTASSSHSSSAPPPPTTATISFTPNISLLNTLSDHYQSSQKEKSNSSGVSSSPSAFFQKSYTVSDEGVSGRPVGSDGGIMSGSHGKNLKEFRREVLGQSVYMFEQSTARN